MTELTREQLASSPCEIIDLQTMAVIKVCPNRKAATRYIDKKERAYGASRYSYRILVA